MNNDFWEKLDDLVDACDLVIALATHQSGSQTAILQWRDPESSRVQSGE